MPDRISGRNIRRKEKTVPAGYIPLRSSGDNRFETISPVKLGTRLKWKSRILQNVMCMFLERKLTELAILCSLIQPKKMNQKQSIPLLCITGSIMFPKDKHAAR